MKHRTHISLLLTALLTVTILTSIAFAAPEAGTEMPVLFTDAFSVSYLENGVKKIVDAENRIILLLPDGIPAPDGYDDAVVLQGPIDNVLFCSSTQLCMLRPFGDDIWSVVGGLTDTAETWENYIPAISDGIRNGDMVYVGGSGMGDPDYELIQELNPDIAFVYTGTSAQSGIIEKLTELGIPYAVDNEYMEATASGRMEWIKFIGAFFDQDEAAVAHVERQAAGLEAMRQHVAGKDKPKVAWGMVYDGIVYAPNGGSYVANAIEDAGGDYVFADVGVGTGSSSQITVEEFYERSMEADVLIYSSNVNYLPNKTALLELAPVFADFSPVVSGNMWQFSLDYYMSTDRAEEQVIELAKIFYPDLYEGEELRHYNKISEE